MVYHSGKIEKLYPCLFWFATSPLLETWRYLNQKQVTTFPLAEGSCNIMQSPDKLGAKADHNSGVLTDMNCTLTTQTSGGFLQFLNILTYISNFKAIENIFTNFWLRFYKGWQKFP